MNNKIIFVRNFNNTCNDITLGKLYTNVKLKNLVKYDLEYELLYFIEICMKQEKTIYNINLRRNSSKLEDIRYFYISFRYNFRT